MNKDRAWIRPRHHSLQQVVAAPIGFSWTGLPSKKSRSRTWRSNNIGLKTSVTTEKGYASKVLLEEASKWTADCIFVGTRDFRDAFERFRLGSVSTAVVTKADCSVEIVRPIKERQQ